jgi:DNA-binding NarL/FixJ family response regulator
MPPASITPGAEAFLEKGRALFDARAWNDAFEALSAADRSCPLGADDLERLSWAAGMTARDDEMLATHERVYHARLDAGESLRAARAAFWVGFRLLAHGQLSSSNGWLSRAQRLVEAHGKECVEQGYLLLPVAQRHLAARQPDDAHDAAARAAAIGDRLGEADLAAFGRNIQARALLLQGRIEPGLALMDEAMMAATSGELSAVVTGIVYCSAIASCHRVYALSRVREWTAALSDWCAAHPQLVMFTGHCLVHRAEMFELAGSWHAAVEEAQRAAARCVRDMERDAAGRAHYQQAEIHRLRGEAARAEEAYRQASRCGIEPYPGLALLRLAQGEHDAASAAIRRLLSVTSDPWQRTRFLPALVEIMLASDDVDAAIEASGELQQTAETSGAPALAAIASHAAGAIALARGDAQGALAPARRAFRVWQQLGAPYLAARMRLLLARACVALGDREAAMLELEAAREIFEQLGARPDLAASDAILRSIGHDIRERDRTGPRSLSERELQVLRHVASGATNKAIARELGLSEKTVDRHVSNIFVKLGVSTRTAATALAYERKLLG